MTIVSPPGSLPSMLVTRSWRNSKCDETVRHVLLLNYLFKLTVLIILNVSFVMWMCSYCYLYGVETLNSLLAYVILVSTKPQSHAPICSFINYALTNYRKALNYISHISAKKLLDTSQMKNIRLGCSRSVLQNLQILTWVNRINSKYSFDSTYIYCDNKSWHIVFVFNSVGQFGLRDCYDHLRGGDGGYSILRL